MDYCGPRGISRSFFLGGPHEWTESDRLWALAWQAAQRERCPHCGTYGDEWRDEKGRILDEPPWVVDSITCGGCEAKGRLEKLIHKQAPDKRGVYVFLRRPRDSDYVDEDDDDEEASSTLAISLW